MTEVSAQVESGQSIFTYTLSHNRVHHGTISRIDNLHRWKLLFAPSFLCFIKPLFGRASTRRPIKFIQPLRRVAANARSLKPSASIDVACIATHLALDNERLLLFVLRDFESQLASDCHESRMASSTITPVSGECGRRIFGRMCLTTPSQPSCFPEIEATRWAPTRLKSHFCPMSLTALIGRSAC
jgi:hypothetical protein